ncbi:hypothetical protein ACFRMN_23170 [Streptomyces sp. NPDC056835]|uniref:hypothetical protein n=1 Tax=Streptomyces sp. NPDC056835 TaxID=3345956 RepID=UPI00369729D4
MAEAERDRGRSFEQVMLLGGDEAAEAAHELHAAVREIDWQATGRRERNRVAGAHRGA